MIGDFLKVSVVITAVKVRNCGEEERLVASEYLLCRQYEELGGLD